MNNFIQYVVNSLSFETYTFFGLFQVLSSLQGIEESIECCEIQDSSLENSYSNDLPTSSTQGNVGKLQEC